MPYKVFSPGWFLHNPLGNPATGGQWRSDWRSFYVTEEEPQKVSRSPQQPEAPAVAGTGQPKVWTGAAWLNKPAKVWTGAAWVEKPVKVWDGSQWKLVN